MAETLRHKIRCAVLAIAGDSLLMFRGQSPETPVHYGPPGGGLEVGEGSILDCAKREFHEETGATVELGNLAYVQQFIVPNDRNELNFYLLAKQIIGDPTIAARAPSEKDEWITEIRYVDREEMNTLTVFPQFLKHRLWDDLASGFKQAIYVGKHERYT